MDTPDISTGIDKLLGGFGDVDWMQRRTNVPVITDLNRPGVQTLDLAPTGHHSLECDLFLGRLNVKSCGVVLRPRGDKRIGSPLYIRDLGLLK